MTVYFVILHLLALEAIVLTALIVVHVIRNWHKPAPSELDGEILAAETVIHCPPSYGFLRVVK